MSRFFRKTKEDFICEHCGAEIAGNGYTNHCPLCLWSKHVDIHPGDRAASCQGLMAPVGYIARHGQYSLIHVCQRCGYRRANKLAANDNLAGLASLC